MHIAHTSAFPSVNALSRSLGYRTFQTHQLLLGYLRWLDQSYGKTITCTLNADRSAAIDVHGVRQLTLTAEEGGIRVRWAWPEETYQPVLQKMSAPDALMETANGAGWEFSVDTQQDNYLLRDLTDHLHQRS